MIYIFRVGEGDYDSYQEVTVAVLRGPAGCDLEAARRDFYKHVVTLNAAYQKIRKKGMPRYRKVSNEEWLAWIAAEYRLKPVAYQEICS